MAGGPVVLLGQGEQYDDPDDWRELIRGRRIRRGVELPVRREGLTALHRPEDVPELAAVLDEVDPPGPPSQTVAAHPPRGAPSLGLGGTSVPPAPVGLAQAATSPQQSPPDGGGPARRPLPTAAPRRGWRFGLWLCLLGVGALLFLRLCARDGFGPLPGFGARSGRSASARDAASSPETAACARPRGWIATAACGDLELARLRKALANAYAVRAAGLSADERAELAAEQARWQAGRSACRTTADPAACLAPRYRSRIAELKEGRPPASGPQAEAPSTPLDAPLEPAQRVVAVVDAPQWTRRPNGDEMADAFPERALRLDIDGRARLTCRVTGTGALTACDVLSEDPPDYGFGGAALRLSRDFQMRPVTPDGRSVEGARVEVPVAFKGG